MDVQRNIGAVNITLGVEGIRGGQAAAAASKRSVQLLPDKISVIETGVCVELPG